LILSGLVKFNQFGLKGLNTIMHKNVSNLSICGFVLITMILAGLPPFIGFHAKVLVFTYLIYGSDYISLFLLGISASGIVYTYLRILTFVTCVVKNKTIYSYSTIVENLN
jgi:NADH:ubiquinone oxidoreductase subunit 2 (subunit N)